MSKAVSKSAHYLPKTGSYSVRLSRNGDIGDTSPATAKDALYTNLQERANRCRETVLALEREIHANRRITGYEAIQRHHDLVRQKRVVEAEIKAIRGEQQRHHLKTYAEQWLIACRLLLPQETLDAIDSHVTMRIGLPPRGWNRFLAESGFGKADTTKSWTDKGLTHGQQIGK
jgi:hypothetical protein